MPPRKFKPRERSSSVRDARLIIIATEGTYTEGQYFRGLTSDEKYRNSRVHVEVLERETTLSSPENVMSHLDNFKRTYRLNKYDELWMVIDVDKWGDEKLSDIATQCSQKNYSLAVSNPCFEIWLLLHLTGLDIYSDAEIQVLFKNKRTKNKTRTPLEDELIKFVGEYNKSNLNMTHYIPHVEMAIERAEALDTEPNHRWVMSLGTRVYQLAKLIIKK